MTAVNQVDLDLRSGEVLGIIGPNGAGKTTLIDAITGYVAADGTIRLNDADIHGLPPHRRSRLGIIRSFQSLELFEDLTVAENLLVASEDSRYWHGTGGLVWPRRPALRGAAAAAVREFELTGVAAPPAIGAQLRPAAAAGTLARGGLSSADPDAGRACRRAG